MRKLIMVVTTVFCCSTFAETDFISIDNQCSEQMDVSSTDPNFSATHVPGKTPSSIGLPSDNKRSNGEVQDIDIKTDRSWFGGIFGTSMEEVCLLHVSKNDKGKIRIKERNIENKMYQYRCTVANDGKGIRVEYNPQYLKDNSDVMMMIMLSNMNSAMY